MLRPFQHISVQRSHAYGVPLTPGMAVGTLAVVAAFIGLGLRFEKSRSDALTASEDRKKLFKKVYEEVYMAGLSRGYERATRNHLRATAQILEEQGEGTEAEIYEELRKMFRYADREK